MSISGPMTDLNRALERLGEVDYKVRKATTPSEAERDAALRAVDEAARAWLDWRSSGEQPWPSYLE